MQLPLSTVRAALFFCVLVSAGAARAQQSAPPPQKAAAFDEWGDTFDGGGLDETKWERFTFEGGGGGKLEVRDGQLRLRSANQTRAGVRSKNFFTGDRFSVEADLAKVGPQMPQPGERAAPLGFAALTILFDSSGRNRVEWILTSEGTFEAWAVVDGRSERLDNRKLGTKLKNPVLGVVRRGDELLFVLNGRDSPPEQAQVGLRKTIKNLPTTFHVMLYGFGSSENNWDAVRVVTLK
ncbi:MAG TPA: hypothetical protein VF588_07490 [Pyrinomonadaceae bacterium]|jgi:hypothetical protein